MAQAGQIFVEGLQVGMYTEVDYYNPNGPGIITINLRQDSDNTVLHFNPRFADDTSQNFLNMNTRANGDWVNKEGGPGGYDFTHGLRMKVRFYADTDSFKIFLNEKFLYRYKYIAGLTCAHVKIIEFKWGNGDDATGAQLVSLKTGYM